MINMKLAKVLFNTLFKEGSKITGIGVKTVGQSVTKDAGAIAAGIKQSGSVLLSGGNIVKQPKNFIGIFKGTDINMNPIGKQRLFSLGTASQSRFDKASSLLAGAAGRAYGSAAPKVISAAKKAGPNIAKGIAAVGVVALGAAALKRINVKSYTRRAPSRKR